ncbi:CMGC/CLK protein kinase [Thecamonas trahens ATCC 50062]|uniref:CMGC/CLK protein kinase n=1 Tax=Thecamonas trahens ATCC 50062 TaxID=461836 RepID=A0A0L0D716_THETB|nr:CMGC/CLK protein kinase [Thecamonas trahens ATCC 50062]KNC48139.1 CMGC/CLK protein kinase [Thecamonas trahens ATCC 50062]|eukprot:XP_013758709.1 CMGC/CLK protein kinase [Thecamonas trahens ATCC 50062]
MSTHRPHAADTSVATRKRKGLGSDAALPRRKYARTFDDGRPGVSRVHLPTAPTGGTAGMTGMPMASGSSGAGPSGSGSATSTSASSAPLGGAVASAAGSAAKGTLATSARSQAGAAGSGKREAGALYALTGKDVLALPKADQVLYATRYGLLVGDRPVIPSSFVPPGARSAQWRPAGGSGTSKSSKSSGAHKSAASGTKKASRHGGSSSSRAPKEPRPSCDDENGHFIVRLGSNITSRYKIQALLGEGTFGKVVEAWDNKRRQWVAIKIIRNIPKYRKAAEIEMNILDDVEQREAKNGDSGCIHLRGYFDYRNHVCMVFKRYGLSVFDFMKENKYRGFRYNHTIDLAYQLIYSVAYLHDMDLIHTDLKPENILFANSDTLPTYDHTGRERSYRLPASTAIKLIDFGSATYEHDYHSSVVSTRHYRAPEVILGLGWSFPCDIWSVGCILIELLTGEAVFQTHDNVEHLAMMERLLGAIPPSMARNADSHAQKYFDASGKLRWPELAQSKSSLRHVEQITPIDLMFSSEKRLLVDLVKKMLRFEPGERITARHALRHELFNKVRERIIAYEKQQRSKAARPEAAAAAARPTTAPSQ